MKKKILLFAMVAGLGSLTISSWKTGAAFNVGAECTGAETGLSNPTGCSIGGSSCHNTSATTGITVAIELDSAGIATAHYKGGMAYTIKITATNTTSNTLPAFGFQVGVIEGSTAVFTPMNAGTWTSTGLPTGVRYTPAVAGSFVVSVMEQSTPLSPTSGTGATGTTYVESLKWTAPVAGTGTISIWSAVNAVNNNGVQDAGDLWNTNHAVINEWPARSAVSNVVNNINIKVYPNPTINNLNLQFDNSQSGIYAIRVYDLSGRIIYNENLEVNGSGQLININTANWALGMYEVVMEKEGDRQIIPVVKQ